MSDRRFFLKSLLGTAAALSVSSKDKLFAMAAKPSEPKENQKMDITEKRTLGKTGLKVSPIAFGGIVVMNETPEKSSSEVERSINAGINYFDVAPSYGDAEEKLGPALEPFRKDVYLACKTGMRDAEGAKKELDASLKRLRTDHFDVYQLHAITDVEKDVKAVFAKGGAMEVILDAKKNGIIRNVGFSAHSPEAALAALELYDFDTVMYPVNFCTHFNSGFEDEVLKLAKKRNCGIIALKAFAKQQWQDDELKKKYPKCWYEPIDDPQLAVLALSWTLQQGVSIAIPPGQNELYQLALDIIPQCKQLNDQEIAKLESVSKTLVPLFTA